MCHCLQICASRYQFNPATLFISSYHLCGDLFVCSQGFHLVFQLSVCLAIGDNFFYCRIRWFSSYLYINMHFDDHSNMVFCKGRDWDQFCLVFRQRRIFIISKIQHLYSMKMGKFNENSGKSLFASIIVCELIYLY